MTTTSEPATGTESAEDKEFSAAVKAASDLMCIGYHAFEKDASATDAEKALSSAKKNFACELKRAIEEIRTSKPIARVKRSDVSGPLKEWKNDVSALRATISAIKGAQLQGDAGFQIAGSFLNAVSARWGTLDKAGEILDELELRIDTAVAKLSDTRVSVTLAAPFAQRGPRSYRGQDSRVIYFVQLLRVLCEIYGGEVRISTSRRSGSQPNWHGRPPKLGSLTDVLKILAPFLPDAFAKIPSIQVLEKIWAAAQPTPSKD